MTAMQQLSMAALDAYRVALRLLSPIAGLTRLAFNPVSNALFARLPREALARTAESYRVPVDLWDCHGRILWLFGSNDFRVARTVCTLLRPGDIFLDIGANHGSIGFAAGRAVGPSGAVHLFEPQPGLAGRLRRVIAAHGLTPFRLRELALYDREGSFEMQVPDRHAGMATLIPRAGRDRGRRRGVSTVTVRTVETGPYLAPLLEGRGFGVKIDIEGAEPAVIPGVLAQPGLRFVVFEGASNGAVLFGLFTRAGFAVLGLARRLGPVRLERVGGMADWQRFHDFVAVPAAAYRRMGAVAAHPRRAPAVTGWR
jgi:FkbM family methyltransferase